MISFSLAELAERFNLRLVGDANHRVSGVATLESAEVQHLSFFASSKYRTQLLSTRAGAVLVRPADQAVCVVNALVSANPHADFARIATLFAPKLQ